MTVTIRPEQSPYSFDNNDPEATHRHVHLSAMLDQATFARLSGLGDLSGLRCLELGAGGGSVARWLVEHSGPTGRVLATDLNTRHLPTDQGYAVLQHNLVTEPVPEGPWDLIHARLVLLHIPQRREIVSRLVAALAPGGLLVIEDWLTSLGSLVLAAPDERVRDLFDAYQETLIGKLLPAAGNDPDWAARVHSVLLAEGLIDVQTQISSESWPGGTAGVRLVTANIGQLRAEFLSAGFTAAQLDELCRLTEDPRLVLRGNFLYSTVGRRPRQA